MESTIFPQGMLQGCGYNAEGYTFSIPPPTASRGKSFDLWSLLRNATLPCVSSNRGDTPSSGLSTHTTRVGKIGGMTSSTKEPDRVSRHPLCSSTQVLIQRSIRSNASGESDEDRDGRPITSQLMPAELSMLSSAQPAKAEDTLNRFTLCRE
jgi:hypothetical protein